MAMPRKPWSVAKVASLGGSGRRDKLTPEQRQAAAREAALARWKRMPKAARQEAGRKAVLARWARVKGQERMEGSVVIQHEIAYPALVLAEPPQEWLDDMKTIWAQAIELLHQRRVYRLIRDMVLRNPALPKESVVYDWINTGYVYTAAMTVRRLVDLRKGTISLRRLLERIAARPAGITRAWFVDKYDPRLRGILPGQDRSSADRDFDELTGACGSQASADVVKADREILCQAAETIKRYTDEHIAHHSAKPTAPPPTHTDLDAAIDTIAQIADRYARLLMMGGVMEPMVPEAMEAVFQVPWDPEAGRARKEIT